MRIMEVKMSGSIEERVKEIVTSHVDFAVDINSIDKNSYLDVIGVNSINFIRTVLQLEEEYSIQFDIDKLDFGTFETFGNLIKYVEELVS